ncbi:MAG: rhodanese-like domain-containing protein [Planctomycetota bacterium]
MSDATSAMAGERLEDAFKLSAPAFREGLSADGVQVFDLRDPGEAAGGMLPSAKLLPWRDEREFGERLADLNLDRRQPLRVYCQRGRRSEAALPVILAAGFDDVAILEGGVLAWEAAGLPTAPNARAFWDAMYGREGHLYGKEPNVFFARQIAALPPGRLLLPAEGEGRNAIYAAKLGWRVDAFDISEVARTKAMRFADHEGVWISYRLADFASPGLGEEKYDAVALIYSHVPSAIKAEGHAAIAAAIKPGGMLFVECFDKSHPAVQSGFGPQSAEMLYGVDELRRDFVGFEIQRLEVTTDAFDHGRHAGPGRVVRMIARKTAADETKEGR